MTSCASDSKYLAYGILEGGIPFAGKFLDGGSVADVSGDLQWQTFIPDSNPEEGKLDVAMVLFVNGVDVGKRPSDCMRLDCCLVSRLNAGSADAEETILGMLLESSGNSGRFDIHRAA